MKILFIGDTVGRSGRGAVRRFLPDLKEKTRADIVILNAENLANGKFPTEKTLCEMEEAGADFFTGGNHSFQDLSIYESGRDNLIRPANLENDAPGLGYALREVNGNRLGIVNLIGRVFMRVPATCPFRKMDQIFREWEKEELDGVFVDFHAETTSEKTAFFHHFRGRVAAVIGTHTHVPTADAKIWPEGSFYMTDIGMTGPEESIIGLELQSGIENFLSPVGKKSFVPSLSPAVFRAVLLDISAKKTHNFNVYQYFEHDA